MSKKLTCHCEKVELEVNIPSEGFKKLMRCNCSLCKRKGAVMSPFPKEDVKIVKGQEIITGDYGYFDTVKKSYKVKSDNTSKVKVTIKNTDE